MFAFVLDVLFACVLHVLFVRGHRELEVVVTLFLRIFFFNFFKSLLLLVVGTVVLAQLFEVVFVVFFLLVLFVQERVNVVVNICIL
jgi:hypothetical protein